MATAESVDDRPIEHPCPFCGTRPIETAATAPFIRGMVLAYRHGKKIFVGCRPCVRMKLLGEAGRSSLIGWFSLSAILVNPILILWNALRVPFIGRNYARARRELRAAGFPVDEPPIDLVRSSASLCAAVLHVNGPADASAIDHAATLFAGLIRDADASAYRALLESPQNLGEPLDEARRLQRALRFEGRQAILSGLAQVANFDGQINAVEDALLTRLGVALGAMAAPVIEVPESAS